MKLKESKEKVPATFVTSYISDAWEKVGYIKADLEAIKRDYSDTKIVCDCLQDIMDAYLIAAGRLQAFLDNKNYVDMPDTADTKVEEALTEAVEEPVTEDANIDDIEIKIDTVNITPKFVEDNLDAEETEPVMSVRRPVVTPVAPQQPAMPKGDFEYTCDFDDPEITQDDAAKFAQIMNVNR